ncbi:MAG TPA: flagella basal body P-ring formation protein FlgA [Silvibacterium sp.]|nr:flagella basal body P-ring formation protein FlgA [Silvibacterium sp.]
MRALWVGLISCMFFTSAPVPAGAQAAGKLAGSSPLDQQSLAPKTVEHGFSDPVLKRRWQLIVDRRHPDWPPQAIEVMPTSPLLDVSLQAPGELPALPDAPAPAIAPMIQTGSGVELWSEAPVHIRLSGTALQAAQLGQRIHVRVGISGKQLEGIVRGPRSIQLVFDTPIRRKP